MNNIRAAVIAAFLLALPVQAQVRRGSLVVWIVSQRADYVVIGAESRRVDSAGKFMDDRSCKVISLGGDTLFYETGLAEIGVRRGKSWNSEGTARSVYTSSQKRDALSLSIDWRNRALRWFYPQSEQDLRKLVEGPNENLVTGGFINFNENAKLSIQSTTISFNAAKRILNAEPTSQAPGQIGVAGVAIYLVQEFFDGKTDRALRAFGPIGKVRLRAVDSSEDVRLVRTAIKFAMDNAVGKDKLSLGGDIDIAIIRNVRSIQWINRKPWCSQQDLKPTHPLKHN